MRPSFTIESAGYSRYLFHRGMPTRLGWTLGAIGLALAALALLP